MTNVDPTPPPAPTNTPTGPKPARRSKRGPLIFAFVVITIGVWLLAEAMGYSVPPFSRIWPVFLLIGGVASLLDYLTISRRPRSAGQAAFGIGLGAIFFVFTLGYARWGNFLDWLPAVPLVIGAAMLVTWAAAGKRDTGLFTGSMVVLALGLLGIFARFQFLRDLLPSAQVVWAVALLFVGLIVAWRVFTNNNDEN